MIFVSMMEAGERVLRNVSQYIQEELKLKVNRQKSKVDMVWNCVYLGFIIGVGGTRRIAPASVKKLKWKNTDYNPPVPSARSDGRTHPRDKRADELLQAGSHQQAMSGAR